MSIHPRTLRLAVISLISVALAAIAAYLTTTQKSPQYPPPPKNANTLKSNGAPTIGGSFSLTDDRGNPVTEKSLADGYYHLIFFGFSSCPDVCPGMLQTMAGIMEGLPQETRNQLKMIFVSVDPDRDTLDKLGTYVRSFHPTFTGWTGTKEAIDSMTKNYLAYYARVPTDGGKDYTINHSSFLYVFDKQGNFVTHLRSTDSATSIRTALESIVKNN